MFWASYLSRNTSIVGQNLQFFFFGQPDFCNSWKWRKAQIVCYQNSTYASCGTEKPVSSAVAASVLALKTHNWTLHSLKITFDTILHKSRTWSLFTTSSLTSSGVGGFLTQLERITGYIDLQKESHSGWLIFRGFCPLSPSIRLTDGWERREGGRCRVRFGHGDRDYPDQRRLQLLRLLRLPYSVMSNELIRRPSH